MRKLYIFAATALLAAPAWGTAPRLAPMTRHAAASGTPLAAPTFTQAPATAMAAQLRGSRALEGWNPLGAGTLRDDFVTTYYLVDPVEWEVEISESATTPGLYLVHNPYDGYPLRDTYNWPVNQGASEGSNYIKVHAEDPAKVWIEASPTGLQLPDGYLIVYSYAGLHYDNNEQSWDFADPTEKQNVDGSFGTMDANYGITFPYTTLLCQLSDDPYRTVTQWDHGNRNSSFRLRLPMAKRYDIALDATVEGTVLHASVEAERDVERLRVALAPGDDNWAAMQDVINEKIEYQEVRGNSGKVDFEIPQNGTYTLVAVAYGGGEAQTFNYMTREYAVYNDGWRTCQEKALYTDGVISAISTDGKANSNFLGIASWTGQVTVQVSTDNPGLVRLVNPFSSEAGCPMASSGTYDPTANFYMEFDVTDPDYVMMNRMPDTGLRFQFGEMMVESRSLWYIDLYGEEKGWYDHSPKAMEYAGQLRDGVITFPVNALHVKFPMIQPSDAGGYYSNSTGDFKVVLPAEALSGVASVEADGAQAVYYDLTGRRVANPGHGVYIKVSSGNASKVRM